MQKPDVVLLLQRRDSQAAEQLLTHYRALMHYIMRPILPDSRDQEECLQDIVLRVLEKIDSFDSDRGSFTAWLTAITRNAALNRARAREDTLPLHDRLEAPDANPEQILLKKERQRLLERALYSLSDQEKLLFYRKYYYRQSTYQIAAELGLSERAVEGRLYRIRRKLQTMLGGESDV